MKVVEGNFGKKEGTASIPSSEFLSRFAIKALDHEEQGRKDDSHRRLGAGEGYRR